MALYAHLWTGGPPPTEYVNVRFYREFGWTPEELKRQPSGEILNILAVWEVEGKVKRARGATAGSRGRNKWRANS